MIQLFLISHFSELRFFSDPFVNSWKPILRGKKTAIYFKAESIVCYSELKINLRKVNPFGKGYF